MNKYRITIYDYNKQQRFHFHIQATGLEDAGRQADEDCQPQQVVENIALVARGLVPFDLTSGTSQC